MKQTSEISHIWLKAAVLGSLWASSEIILGSMLHNLKIPMSGTLLSAIGALIMISGHQLWPEKGLFWRSGLICAVMKSISPSAVIMGPMIGIFMEGVLLELAVLLLGRNLFAYLLGGALAVSWSFVQKIIGLVITFGLYFVDLYENLYFFAAKNLGVSSFGPFDLVLAFWLIQMLFGVIVAIIAVRIGKKAIRLDDEQMPIMEEGRHAMSFGLDPTQQFSLILLILISVGIVAGLLLLSFYPLWIATIYCLLFIAFNFYQYRRSLNRLKKPGLWIMLISVILLSAIFLDGLQRREFFTLNGVVIGTRMSLRAIVILVGFSAVSIELRNPKILDWFIKHSMQDFPRALGVAFETLPRFMSVLSAQKQLWKRLGQVLPQMLYYSKQWLLEYQNEHVPVKRIVFLTGRSGEGKTTLVQKLLRRLTELGLTTGGIYSAGYWQNNKRSGFDVVRIQDGVQEPLCRTEIQGSGIEMGPFHFLEKGMSFGSQAILMAVDANPDVVVVDEVGPLELRGEGWADALDAFVHAYSKPMLWIVRNRIIQDVCIRWRITNPVVLDVHKTSVDEIIEALLQV